MFAETEFADHIVSRFGSQVAILYGSAARGEARSGSDIDVVCFVDGAARYPESYLWRGVLVDAWVHPLTDAANIDDFLKLHDGRVLHDLDGLGQGLLAKVAERIQGPREKLDARHERHRRAWVWKMFDRAVQQGAEGDYRRHWLLFDLPETWCDLAQHHYLGPDNALKKLRAAAPHVHEAVTRALAAGSSLSEIELAVCAVVGLRIPPDESA
ncbi:MAG: nucleotidyltransferase domain-containing protein [Myxococcales bacterium]